MNIPPSIESRLVDGWRSWWKRASVWLAGLAGVVTTVISANQSLYLTLMGMLPPHGWPRVVAALAIGFAVFIVPTITVLWKQKSVASG